MSKFSKFCAIADPAGAGDFCEGAGENGGGGVDGMLDVVRNEAEGSRDRSLDRFETDACERGRRFARSACSSGVDIFSRSSWKVRFNSSRYNYSVARQTVTRSDESPKMSQLGAFKGIRLIAGTTSKLGDMYK